MRYGDVQGSSLSPENALERHTERGGKSYYGKGGDEAVAGSGGEW